jgi:RNA recognition motif-containing protein
MSRQRTIFVGQLTQKVREKDIKRYFEKCGKVGVRERTHLNLSLMT